MLAPQAARPRGRGYASLSRNAADYMPLEYKRVHMSAYAYGTPGAPVAAGKEDKESFCVVPQAVVDRTDDHGTRLLCIAGQTCSTYADVASGLYGDWKCDALRLVDLIWGPRPSAHHSPWLNGLVARRFARMGSALEAASPSSLTDACDKWVARLELERAFSRLADEWRRETAVISSVTDMATHPAYQRIIGMGPAAIPLILRELEREPHYWFWALRSITREDPVKPEDLGNMRKMAKAWIDLGKLRGWR